MIFKKAALNFLAGKLVKHFKLGKILKYVEEPNELDDAVSDLKLSRHEDLLRIENLENRLNKLENINNESIKK